MSNINVSEIVKNTKQHVWVGAIYYIFVIPIMIGLIIGSIAMGEFSIYLIFLLFILGIIDKMVFLDIMKLMLLNTLKETVASGVAKVLELIQKTDWYKKWSEDTNAITSLEEALKDELRNRDKELKDLIECY